MTVAQILSLIVIWDKRALRLERIGMSDRDRIQRLIALENAKIYRKCIKELTVTKEI